MTTDDDLVIFKPPFTKIGKNFSYIKGRVCEMKKALEGVQEIILTVIESKAVEGEYNYFERLIGQTISVRTYNLYGNLIFDARGRILLGIEEFGDSNTSHTVAFYSGKRNCLVRAYESWKQKRERYLPAYINSLNTEVLLLSGQEASDESYHRYHKDYIYTVRVGKETEETYFVPKPKFEVKDKFIEVRIDGDINRYYNFKVGQKRWFTLFYVVTDTKGFFRGVIYTDDHI